MGKQRESRLKIASSVQTFVSLSLQGVRNR
jgi:hypothetical protein